MSVATTALLRSNEPAASARAGEKLVQLEALRGIAALIVVVWHFLWAFDPARVGIADGFDPSAGLLGSVSFASIDGPAAVMLFFVLSGFVLPLGFFRSGRNEAIVRAAAKRWLRLLGLVLLAVLFSYVLFRFGLYRHREAAQLSQSAWLGTFGGTHDAGDFHPSLFGALLNGSLLAFLRDSNQYDPVLWTMHHEFIGSFVTYFLALLLHRARLPVALWFLATGGIVVLFTDPYLLGFVAGTGLAWVMSRYGLRIPPVSALACICIGIFLFGYLEPRGAYAAFDWVRDPGQMRLDRITIHTISGMLVILGLIGNDYIGQPLATVPLRLLGRLSFPLYLFHFPLLCSLGCALFVFLRPVFSYQATLIMVAAAYLPPVIVISYLLTHFDDLWLRWVNRFAADLTRPEPV